MWERDAFVARDVDRLERLRAVDRGLCFGRLDLRDGHRSYIGRIGLSDDEYEPLLIDWRAPAAEPFYRATAASPGEVVRRRHIQTRHRQVTGVDDEVFSLDDVSADQVATLSGEAALLASLEARRSGRMSDIVATIQAEQDRIIRSDARGVLVVQGAPGTGKTVAALHRAAYLLYTHRDRLAERGVLVLGPNRTFLRYIEQVLPSLGETGVVLATVGELFPAVVADADEPDVVAIAKGDPRMAELIAAAVKDLQRAPRKALRIPVDRVELVLEPAEVRRARTRARRSRRPHNEARAVFAREVLAGLARQYAELLGEVVDDEDVSGMRDDLAGERTVRAVLDDLWPLVSPETLVRCIFADADPGDPIHRAGGGWTPADVPLLDEAAELLGDVPDEAAEREAQRAAADRRAEAEYAREFLAGLDLGMRVDPELVAERYNGPAARASVVERAAQDRSWAFGHVIVDEAQELSPMAWRMIMRRVPSRSMTVVGDVAQTGAAAGAHSWHEVLDPHVQDRWREETLSVNYRTPAEVMAIGADVLAVIDPSLSPPTSVRSTGESPWALQVEPGELVKRLAEVVASEIEDVDGGRIAVIAPTSRVGVVRAALTEALAGDVVGHDDPTALDAPVSVLGVRQAKGLEFDVVVVVEPAEIVDDSPRGATDLYVAITRPTRRLGVVHSGDLPDALGRLVPVTSPPSTTDRSAPSTGG